MKRQQQNLCGGTTITEYRVVRRTLLVGLHVAILGVTASCNAAPPPPQVTVVIDQGGYRTNDPKVAFLKEPQRGEFDVVNVATNKPAFRGTIHAIGFKDDATGDVTYSLNFTGLTKPGKYQIIIPGTSDASPEFFIGPTVYNDATITCLQSFYFQRCGMEVGAGTLWHHPPCHTEPAHFFWDQSKTKDMSGGWHDAGDYNKFVPTTAVSVAFLLYLYERRPAQFYDGQLAIPEAGNGVPDILDEARWALNWLLKMQADDGGVYHKVSIKKWTGEHLPQDEHDMQYIFQETSTSTGDFAAVTAMAARDFESWDRQYAQTLLRASLKAWTFLEKHTSELPPGGFKNPPGVEGGEYSDDQDGDERLWASVELYRTTGSDRFQDYFLSKYATLGGFSTPLGWQHVLNFALSSYLRLPVHSQDLKARAYLASSLLQHADQLLLHIEQNGYRYVLSNNEYYWGSNSVSLGYAFDLIQAYDFSSSRRYLDGALDQLHYMLGRNTFGISFETGVGTFSVQHPYHQFSMLLHAGRPVPGMVVAGANKFSALNGRTISEFPGRCYEDKQKNYFVNETAINYTAPLAFLAGSLSHFGARQLNTQNLIKQ